MYVVMSAAARFPLVVAPISRGLSGVRARARPEDKSAMCARKGITGRWDESLDYLEIVKNNVKADSKVSFGNTFLNI